MEIDPAWGQHICKIYDHIVSIAGKQFIVSGRGTSSMDREKKLKALNKIFHKRASFDSYRARTGQHVIEILTAEELAQAKKNQDYTEKEAKIREDFSEQLRCLLYKSEKLMKQVSCVDSINKYEQYDDYSFHLSLCITESYERRFAGFDLDFAIQLRELRLKIEVEHLKHELKHRDDLKIKMTDDTWAQEQEVSAEILEDLETELKEARKRSVTIGWSDHICDGEYVIEIGEKVFLNIARTNLGDLQHRHFWEDRRSHKLSVYSESLGLSKYGGESRRALLGEVVIDVLSPFDNLVAEQQVSNNTPWPSGQIKDWEKKLANYEQGLKEILDNDSIDNKAKEIRDQQIAIFKNHIQNAKTEIILLTEENELLFKPLEREVLYLQREISRLEPKLKKYKKRITELNNQIQADALKEKAE
ncbi:hypothetical protein [Lentisphaera araneosa]|uniref:hypothetical protein n=1 Tax=Lentisphaera araneosa TaxID=256847 RepID=UPI0012F9EBF8|nr:hypothetical protein [Lentisphaera araneosa]